MRQVIRGKIQMDDREKGAGTVLAVGLALAMLLLMVLLLGLGQAMVASAKATKAADLAALAAADSYRGLAGGDPCVIAADVADRNGSVMRSCTLSSGQSVQVEVTVTFALPWPAVAVARAGPPSDSVAPADFK